MALYLLYGPALTTVRDRGKTTALTVQTFAGRVTSPFNTLARSVIAFLTRNNRFLISWLQSLSAVILEPKKRNSVTTSTFSSSICHGVMGPDAMILVFLILSLKPALSLCSFTLIKRFYSSSSLSAVRVVSSAYLRLLAYLLRVLSPACSSSSPAFLMMCSAYVLNKQGGGRQPCCTPFLILSRSVVPYLVLTLPSWSTYRFLSRQARWSGIPIALRAFHTLS